MGEKILKRESIRRFMTGEIDVSKQAKEYNRIHVFNRLSSSSNYGFYYYPFGYLYRHLRWGGVNALGFRSDEFENYSHLEEFKVVILGGSTVFDVLVPPEHSFCQQLNNFLKSYRTTNGKSIRIINLGQPGGTLATQSVLLALFGGLIKPNLVISHGPFNDFAYGQMNNPYFVGSLALAYPDICEAWGSIIHDGPDDIDVFSSDPSIAGFRPARVRNTPEAIINMINFRIESLWQIASGFGSDFLYSVQPWLKHKINLTEDELSKFKNYNSYHQEVYANIGELYEMFEESVQGKEVPILDLTNIFNNDACVEKSCFGDVIHLNATGNHVLAESYKRFLVSSLGLNEHDSE